MATSSQTLNRKQILVICSVLALSILVAMVPPWRYLDGKFAGFTPRSNPPELLPDSLVTGKIAFKYLPIHIIPATEDELRDRMASFSREELATPYVDTRSVMIATTIIALLGVILLFAFDTRTDKRASGLSVQTLNKASPNPEKSGSS